MKISKAEYFKRQTTLSEIGEEGQELLQQAKVIIIGCGGLGSPIAVYLAASGIGHLHLVDFDTVSISNLHRQVFYNVEDVEKPKAEILATKISKQAPYTKVTFTNEAIDKSSILNLISKFDIIVDGTDSLQIKYLINDACVIAKRPLVYGSLYKFDGYIATFNILEADGRYSCNLRDAFPEIAKDIPNCEEAGTMNPIVGIIALLQVNEVIKIVTKNGKLLSDQLLIYNVLENSQFKMKLKKNESINIDEIFEVSQYSDFYCETQDNSLLISSENLKRNLKNENLKIISVINNKNQKLPFEVHEKMPIISFNIEGFVPDFNKNYIIVCNKGISSYKIATALKNKYPDLRIFSLNKGIEQY